MGSLDYHSNIRHDILQLVEKKREQRVLEIGCGTGNTLAFLKENGFASYVAGVEKEKECFGSINPAVDEMIEGDAEALEIPFEGKFDVILLLDVLEHLYAPFDILKKIRLLLAPSGYIVISIPNIRNYAVLKRLILKGRWDYKDSGVLDRSHIRFFTRRSFLDALEQEGINMDLLDYRPNMENYGKVLKLIPFLKEFFVCQHLFKFQFARPDDGRK